MKEIKTEFKNDTKETCKKAKENIEKLNKDGYIIIKNSVESSIIDAALESIDEFKMENLEVWNQNVDSFAHIRRLTNVHLWDQKIQKLFVNNDALRVADDFFNATASGYTSLYYEAGSEQSIHRDAPHFCTVPLNQFLGMSVAFEDSTSENGCLIGIPGGHLIKEMDKEAIALKHYSTLNQIDPNSQELWDDYQDNVVKECLRTKLKIIQLPLQRGDTIIWHPNFPHGGSSILKNGATRRSLVFHITPPRTPVYHQAAFFNPRKKFSVKPSWNYFLCEDREFACMESIVFPPSNTIVKGKF